MPFKVYTAGAYDNHRMNYDSVKYVKIDGVIVWGEGPEPEVKTVEVTEDFSVETVVKNVQEVTLYNVFTQRWIDENPAGSQLGKIPVDDVSTTTSIASIAQQKLHEKRTLNADLAAVQNQIVGSIERTLRITSGVTDEPASVSTTLLQGTDKLLYKETMVSDETNASTMLVSFAETTLGE